MAYKYSLPRPSVTVDVVIFSMRADDLAVLLVKRKEAPFKGLWALPGGLCDENEPLETAALRKLSEETGIVGVRLEQLGAFGDPQRDPRGHAVSVVYFTLAVAESHRVAARGDATEAKWYPLRMLATASSVAKEAPRLAFDHAAIIDRARASLQERLRDPSRKAAFDLVPSRFTLTELQRVYEAVLGHALDKRNFRARLNANGIVEPVAAQQRTGRHRPAQLYCWKQPRLRR